MSRVEGALAAAGRLDERGRVIVPAELREAARLEPGTDIVWSVDGEGRLILESRSAVKARIRSRLSDDGEREAQGIRDLRDEDLLVSDEAERRQSSAARSATAASVARRRREIDDLLGR